MSAGIRKNVERHLDSWLEYLARHRHWPGFSIAVLQRGQPLYVRAFGVADLTSNTRLTPKHVMRFASHSKVFTAAAIMKLIEQRKLYLDAPVWPLVGGPKARDRRLNKITVRQVLSHTSGLVRDGAQSGFWRDLKPFPSEDELLRELAETRLVFPPGRTFKYSNHGFSLLGVLIARLSGESYEEFCLRHLGVRELDASLRPEASFLKPGSPFANGYSAALPLLDGKRVIYPFERDTRAAAAATGWCARPEAMAQWFSQLILERKIISQKFLKPMMQASPASVVGTDGSGYGLGLSIVKYKKRRLYGHSGGFPSQISRTLVDPSTGITVSWALSESWDGELDRNAFTAGLFGVVDHCLNPQNANRTTDKYFARLETVTNTFALWPSREGLVAPTLKQLNPLEGATRFKHIKDNRFTCIDPSGYGSSGETVTIERRGGRVHSVCWGGFPHYPGRSGLRGLKTISTSF